MVQNSKKWHSFRKKHIGASEAPAVLGKDPYKKTPHKLWMIKTGLIKEPEIFHGMVEKGGAAEARVRARYEMENGMSSFPPIVAFHPEFTFISASFDGYNQALNKGCEIKFVGEKKFKEILESQKLPENNWIQVQQQIFVASADEWDYLYTADTTGQHYEKITVLPDLPFQKMLLEKEIELWKHIKSKTDPGLTSDDDDIIKDKAILKLIRERTRALAKEEFWKLSRERIELKIEKNLTHNKSLAPKLKIRIKRSEKTGKYSYTSTVKKKKEETND